MCTPGGSHRHTHHVWGFRSFQQQCFHVSASIPHTWQTHTTSSQQLFPLQHQAEVTESWELLRAAGREPTRSATATASLPILFTDSLVLQPVRSRAQQAIQRLVSPGKKMRSWRKIRQAEGAMILSRWRQKSQKSFVLLCKFNSASVLFSALCPLPHTSSNVCSQPVAVSSWTLSYQDCHLRARMTTGGKKKNFTLIPSVFCCAWIRWISTSVTTTDLF